MRRSSILFLVMAAASMVIAGCEKPQEAGQTGADHHAAGEMPIDPQQMMRGPAEIVIPEEVKAAWKGIIVEVTNNETGKKESVSIDIGQEKAIPDSTLKIKALNFLPAFQMDGPQVTSRSNEMENPAAQIEIVEGEVYWKGWLFTLYPTTHAYTHPKYSITLVDGIAAEKEPATADKKAAEKS